MIMVDTAQAPHHYPRQEYQAMVLRGNGFGAADATTVVAVVGVTAAALIAIRYFFPSPAARRRRARG